MIRVAFIFVHYNDGVSLGSLLESLSAQIEENAKAVRVEIFVLDNSSEEPHIRQLESVAEVYGSSGVRVLFSDKNLGYFAGANHVLKKNKHLRNFDYVVVGNTDLLFDCNFLSSLVRTEDFSSLVIYPSIKMPDGRFDNPRFIESVPRWRKLAYHLYFAGYGFAVVMELLFRLFDWGRERQHRLGYQTAGPVYLCVGACFILTNKFFRTARYLDDRVFLWGEEVLLSHQVRELGGGQSYDPSLIVQHNEHQSVKLMSSFAKYKIQQKSFRIYCRYL